MKALRIRQSDNVAVALEPIAPGEPLPEGVTTAEAVAAGHKIAIKPIAKGDNIVKYGYPIGHALEDIRPGTWVHTHNCATNLTEESDYRYQPKASDIQPVPPESFMGYLRKDGQAAVRNELWILPLVGCVNGVAERLACQNTLPAGSGAEGPYAFTHPFGCSQTGEDHARTRKLLASLAKHPNAAGVLVVGLGCENLTMEQFKRELGEYDPERIRFLLCQDCEDEYAEGARLLGELADYAKGFSREALPVSKLVIGMKCGGSDGLSGITANPAVGVFCDMLTARGGSALLTEVPEMFGAENILFERCESREVFDKAAAMAERFKDYFTSHGQTVYENPSPGNKAGGITTLEDKSCGCVQKGGGAPVRDVIEYGGRLVTKGLNLLDGPGNDLVSATALTAAGAHIVLFTTGRGTPFGAPAPTVKISTNTVLYEKKRGWIDFDTGTVARGETVEDAGARLFEYVLSVAAGEKTRAEEMGFREISILKGGVTL